VKWGKRLPTENNGSFKRLNLIKNILCKLNILSMLNIFSVHSMADKLEMLDLLSVLWMLNILINLRRGGLVEKSDKRLPTENDGSFERLNLIKTYYTYWIYLVY